MRNIPTAVVVGILVGSALLGSRAAAQLATEREDVFDSSSTILEPRVEQAGVSASFVPDFNTRMAITNSVVDPGYQPLVWVNSGGNLVFKNPDSVGSNGWTSVGITGVDADLAGVSWSTNNNPRQRVFYTKAGFVRQLTYDNNSASDAQLPGLAGYTFLNYLAAASYPGSGNSRNLEVVVAALNTSNSLRLCAFHGTTTQQPSPTWCTSTDTLPYWDVSNIAAVSLASAAPQFFFTDVNQRLGVLVPQQTQGLYTWVTLNSPDANPLRRSLWVGESDAGGSYQIAVVSYDCCSDHAFIGNLPVGGSTVTWTALPTIPNNPAMLYNASVGGVRYVSGTAKRTLLNLVGHDGKLYGITSTNGAWPGSWGQTGILPGGGEFFQSLGIVTTTSGGTPNPRTFLVAGENAGSTMIEYQTGATPALRDHVHFDLGDYVALPAPANESSASISAHMGLAAAIQRNNPPPWKIQIAQAGPSVSGWNAPVLASQLGAITPGYTTSSTDPMTFSGGSDGTFLNRYLHYTEFQLDVLNNGNGTCGYPAGKPGRIIYRRDTSVASLASQTQASPGFYLIASGTGVDHPGLGATFDPYSFSKPTAHVAYSHTSTMYWSLLPNGSASGPISIGSAFVHGGFPMVTTGANQLAYVYAAAPTTWGDVCQLTPGRAPTSSECGQMGGGTALPVPTGSKCLFFGAPQGSQQGLCAATGPYCTSAPSSWHKCFHVSQPVSVAADPVNPKTFYAAYHALDSQSPGGKDLSVYFTKASNSFTAWTTPVRVHSRLAGDQFNYLNPAITVDASGTIVITYSAIHSTEDVPSDQTGAASVYAVWSSNGGSTWSSAAANPVSSWNALSLPYHCGRQMWFLGEYQQGNTLAGRAYQIYPYSTGTQQATTQQRGKFFTRWAM